MGYYELLFAKKLSGGGGGGSSIDVEPLSVTANGTYTAPEGTAYSPVNVNVEGLTVIDVIERTNFPQDVVYTGSHELINSVFSKANGLKSFTATQNITLNSNAFYGAANLETVDMPECAMNNQSPAYIFQDCTSLKTVHLPKVKLLGSNIFRNCTSLKTIVLQSLTSTRSDFFNGCTSLEKLDLPVCTNLPTASLFKNCSSLSTLILRASSVAALGAIANFDGSPFASNGSGGTLYVPASLVASYQSATNWSTILGYANNQIKSIESTHTDPSAPIDLTLYYADGTPIGA